MVNEGRPDPSPATAGPWFFVHLQKTGGTSLLFRLLRRFREEEIYPTASRVADDPERPQLSVTALQREWSRRSEEIRVIAGHFPFATMEILGGNFTSFTILRDPVARTVSNLREQAVANPRMAGLPLEEVYRRVTPFTRNHMMRMLASTAEEVLETERIGRWPLFLWLDPTEERRARAEANLARIDVVGFTEDLEAFCADLERRFGWDLGDPLHTNTSPPLAIPDGLLDRIREDNAADLALYRFARERAGLTGEATR